MTMSKQERKKVCTNQMLLETVPESSGSFLGPPLCSPHLSYSLAFGVTIDKADKRLLQYFDTVGWVFRPVKTVSNITYTVLAGT